MKFKINQDEISLISKIIGVFEKGNGENDAEGVDPPIFATKTDEPRSDRLGLFSFSQLTPANTSPRGGLLNGQGGSIVHPCSP